VNGGEEMEIEIKVAEYPRKAKEYAVRVLDKGVFVLCPCPYTPYKAQADIIAKAFEVFIANGGEQAIREAANELP
jgi:hypothetical protein